MVAWAAAGAALKAAAPAIGKFAGSALGGLLGGSSGGIDIGASKTLMRYQNNLQKDYTQWLNENSYSQMRTGLENAGYNPLLAVGANPQSGATGIATATSGNTAQVDGEKALQALLTLSQIKNIQADTDIKNSGIITKFLGTGFVNSAKGKIKGWLDNITNSAKEVREISDDVQTLLKGSVTHTANSPTGSLPRMFSYQPDIEDKGNLDNTDLKELKMIRKIERRRKRYGL